MFMANVSKGVTRIYSRNIKPGHEQQYDDWLRRYLTYERQARGYLGTTVIVPGGTNSNLRYIIHHFANSDSLDEWERSEQAIKMLEEVNNYSTRHYETATGLETWFTVPDLHAVAAPPKWKMAVIVFAAAFAISTSARYLLNHYLESTSLFISNVVYTAILVLLLTYLAMPALSRLLRKWLYSKKENEYA
ncbi:hypothetical protein NTE_01135 [Candidatus Nitrososphaera evergladensis SR1]|uniref:ABM domain-containing protein n=2 Tax=Nitrososphaera TaxID=497726 RepID=A0A075MPT0_9ARCH|nr:hypothetical protein NTE_01135 [Candidatus Nitrososphaera evergladensis SR1]